MGRPTNSMAKKQLVALVALALLLFSSSCHGELAEELINAESGQLEQRGLASLMMRELVLPFNSINQLADWINQVPRSVFLDCPTDEVAFGLVCDPNQISRLDLDNYFCGSSPSDYGWCGAFWDPASNPNQLRKRGVSNGAIAVNNLNGLYTEMFQRVCSCHCGCGEGCFAKSYGGTLEDITTTTYNGVLSLGCNGGTADWPSFPCGGTLTPFDGPTSGTGVHWYRESLTYGVGTCADDCEYEVTYDAFGQSITSIGVYNCAGYPAYPTELGNNVGNWDRV